MELDKETKTDKIEILLPDEGHPMIQVRTAIIVTEGGKEISRTSHRRVLTPDTDLSKEDLVVASICSVVFTTEVQNNYRNRHTT